MNYESYYNKRLKIIYQIFIDVTVDTKTFVFVTARNFD